MRAAVPVSTTKGVSQLIRSSQGSNYVETLWLPANPLYILSYCLKIFNLLMHPSFGAVTFLTVGLIISGVEAILKNIFCIKDQKNK